MQIYLDGIGILGPGLADWTSSQRILKGDQVWVESKMTPPTPNILSANEQRRGSETVKLALHVAQEAIDHSQMKPQEVGTVFASSDGDGTILHQLCTAVAAPVPQVSPTLFHHSVHNAPAGYWSIAHSVQLPSTSVSCHDGTFSAGLVETALQTIVETRSTLLVVYDTPSPPPLSQARPILAAFGIALVIRQEQSEQSIARLDISLYFDRLKKITTLEDCQLEKYRREIPTARGLPLLAAIARQETTTVVLEYLDNCHLTIDVTSCPSYQKMI